MVCCFTTSSAAAAACHPCCQNFMGHSSAKNLKRELCNSEISRIVRPQLLNEKSFMSTSHAGMDAILDLTIQATIQATENSTNHITGIVSTTFEKSSTRFFVLAAALVQQAALDTNECGGVVKRELLHVVQQGPGNSDELQNSVKTNIFRRRG
jgi:hypothetical protein